MTVVLRLQQLCSDIKSNEAVIIVIHILSLKPEYLPGNIWWRICMRQQNQQCQHPNSVP